MALINCPECGEKVSDKAPACIHCGYPLHNNKLIQYCPYCGKQNSMESSFCGFCGRAINAEEDSHMPAVINTPNSSFDIMDFKKDLDASTEPIRLQQIQIMQQQQHLEEQRRQYEAQAKCPKCGSPSLSGGKQGFGYGNAVAGAVLFGGVGLLAGGIGANQTVVTCLNCGYKFKL